VLSSDGAGASALLLHSRGSLFPVFNGKTDIDTPFFLERALKNINLYSLQGLTGEIEMLEAMLAPLGLRSRETVDFKLMALERDPPPVKKPTGVSFRRAESGDTEALLPLQTAYEKEEVLPAGAIFDIRACRYNLERIIEKEKTLVALVDGRIIAKINTNAESYSRCQIGGVYVLPEYRGRGIASCLTAAFSRLLLVQNKGINLFASNGNIAALKTYSRCGFQEIADYRIVYL
jgi:predicted GNAT family acetyltransferase